MSETVATCRGCRRELEGKPYHLGGDAYVPGPPRTRAKKNYYGGFVCCRECDVRACRELENSMPGHGYDQTASLSYQAKARVESNWREE